MDAGEYDITIDPRGSYRQRYVFDDAGDPPTLLDFTGCEARAEIRNRAEGETLYISVSETPGADGYITLNDQGEVVVYFTPAATAGMANVRRAAWDLFIEYPSGEDVPKFLYGLVTIRQSVTDPSYD